MNDELRSFHAQGVLAPAPPLTDRLLGDLSEKNRIEFVESPEAWIDFFNVALKKWDDAGELLPESVLASFEPILLDAVVRFRDFDALSTKAGKTLHKRLSLDKVPRPPSGIAGFDDVGELILPLLQAWFGLQPQFGRRFDCHPAASLHRFVIERLQAKKPVTLLSTPTHRNGWIDPLVWIDRILDNVDSIDDVHPLDWAFSLLRLSPQKRCAAWKKFQATEGFPRQIQCYVQTALDDEFEPADVEGDPRILLAAIRGRDPQRILPREWCWVDDLRGPDSRFPADYVWVLPIEMDPCYPKLSVSVVDQGVDVAGAREQIEATYREMLTEKTGAEDALDELPDGVSELLLSIVRNMAERSAFKIPDDALPPISLSAGLSHDGSEDLEFWSPGLPWFATSMATIRPGNLDWLWIKTAPDFFQRDCNKDAKTDFPEAVLRPLLQPDYPVSRSAARLLWMGWNNRAVRLCQQTIEVSKAIIATDRFDANLIADVFQEVSHCDWWDFKRIAATMTRISESSPVAMWRMAQVGEQVLVFTPTTQRSYLSLAQFVAEAIAELGLEPSVAWLENLATSKNAKLKKLAKQLSTVTATTTPSKSAALDLQASIWNLRQERLDSQS
ncbi:MAG: DUF6493 family protein [Planctomycetota bacterium]